MSDKPKDQTAQEKAQDQRDLVALRERRTQAVATSQDDEVKKIDKQIAAIEAKSQ